MKPAGKPATLKDVAKATGYSVNTISRALRNKEDIGQETRQKIKAAAREMGYVNNTLASSLRLGYTKTIAVILGDISNPHFGIMLKEIETAATAFGYTSFLLNTGEDEKKERQAIRSALNKSVDGIIICPTQKSEDNIRYLLEVGIPFVQIGRYFANVDASYVVCNDELGGYQATCRLLKAGHRSILMLHGPAYISSARERLAGYRRALAEYGVPEDPKLIREVPITSGGAGPALRAVEKEGIPYTAAFCFSDMVAWDAWNSLLAMGKQVPEDCSLIGFDNIQSRLIIPHQLNTISSFKKELSATAVDCLSRQIAAKGEAAPPVKKIVIDTRLVEGETVVPPPPSPSSLPARKNNP